MAQVVDGGSAGHEQGEQGWRGGVVANALPIQCTYKEKPFGDRVKQLLDPANAPPQCPPPILDASGKVRI
jgi:hypothetical protein